MAPGKRKGGSKPAASSRSRKAARTTAAAESAKPGGTTGAASSSSGAGRAPGQHSTGTPLSFERYADPEEGVVTMEGLARLAEELGIDAATDTKLLVLCWRLGAEKPGALQRDEWARLETCPELPTFRGGVPHQSSVPVGHSQQQRATVETLKAGWGRLDPAFLENSEFRPFFKFCFEFNRDGTKKFLERDTAVALLPLCVENRSPHTTAFVDFVKQKPDDFKLNRDQWTSFLDFSLAVGPAPDFDGWNAEESSWPILLDEFVEYSADAVDKQQRQLQQHAGEAAESSSPVVAGNTKTTSKTASKTSTAASSSSKATSKKPAAKAK